MEQERLFESIHGKLCCYRGACPIEIVVGVNWYKERIRLAPPAREDDSVRKRIQFFDNGRIDLFVQLCGYICSECPVLLACDIEEAKTDNEYWKYACKTGWQK